MKIFFTSIAVLSAVTTIGALSCYISKQPQVSNITIYYVTSFYTVSYNQKSCSDLAEYSDNGQSVGKIELGDKQRIKEFLSALGKIKFIKLPDYSSIDVAICCILKRDDGVVLKTISFGLPPVMQVDNVVYDRDSTFFEYIVRNYLPKDYTAQPSNRNRTN
jgi:hypothetical protein